MPPPDETCVAASSTGLLSGTGFVELEDETAGYPDSAEWLLLDEHKGPGDEDRTCEPVGAPAVLVREA